MSNQLFGSVLSSAETPKYVVKSSDETVNNSSTYQSDDALTISLEASSTYYIEVVAFYSTNDTADFKFRQSYSGSVSSVYFTNEFNVPAGDTMLRERTYTTIGQEGSTGTASGGGTHGMARMVIALNTSTSGTWAFQWAQQTADASDTKVLQGSHIKVLKIS